MMTSERLTTLVTPLLFFVGGLWVLWNWLAKPGERGPFWVALCAVLIAAGLTFAGVRRRSASTTEHHPKLVWSGLGAAGIVLVLVQVLPMVVLVPVVTAGSGLILGLWAVEVVEARMNRPGAQGGAQSSEG